MAGSARFIRGVLSRPTVSAGRKDISVVVEDDAPVTFRAAVFPLSGLLSDVVSHSSSPSDARASWCVLSLLKRIGILGRCPYHFHLPLSRPSTVGW